MASVTHSNRNRVTEAKPQESAGQDMRDTSSVTSFGFPYYPMRKGGKNNKKYKNRGKSETCNAAETGDFERALLAAASLALVLMLLGSACHALGDHGAARHERQGFASVADIPKDAAHEKRKERRREVHAQLAQMRSADALAASKAAFGQETTQEPTEWETATQGGLEAPGVITRQGGVNWFNGRRETWYSSQTLYHWRTPEWTPDEEGFYRTSDGYYVVAASDLLQGGVIETSKGLAMVLDCGCAPGTTDFYVNWDCR